jgi:2-desacetyl-2-hydroxyethyl bacteriochlorophyllide A dehydrogenase
MQYPEDLSMRRYELVDRQRIQLKTDVPVPQPSTGQILVKVGACTVCGRSDLVYYHYLGLRDHCAQGCFGHEIAGFVEAVGPAVDRIQPGERVFIRTPLTSGYADYALAREVAVGKLPDSIPFAQAAILQLLPLAVHATRGVRLGDRVLIVGQGPVGLMALQVARLRGASSIAVTDLDPWRLECSARLGAHTVVAQGMLPKEILKEEWDVAIDAVGTEKTVRSCMAAVRHNGIVVLLGTHHIDTNVSLDLVQWEKKSLQVQSSAEPHDEARREALRVAEQLVNGKMIQLEPLLTHTYALNDLQQAINHLSQSNVLFPASEMSPFPGPPPQTLKVAICP